MPQSGIVTVVRTLLFWSRGTWMTTGALAVTGPEASDVENVGIGRVSTATVGRSSSVMKRRFAETTGFTSRTTPSTAFLTMGEDRAGYLVEVDETSRIFTNPRERLTEDYVSGRFG